MRHTTWTLDLLGHGEFKTKDIEVERNMKETKNYLAQSITEAYGDSQYPKTYWLHYPKHLLAVVLAGLQYPLN